jgi:hypothetical protein
MRCHHLQYLYPIGDLGDAGNAAIDLVASKVRETLDQYTITTTTATEGYVTTTTLKTGTVAGDDDTDGKATATAAIHEWRRYEAAILALGAINSATHRAGHIVLFPISAMYHIQPCIRATALWCASVLLQSQESKENVFPYPDKLRQFLQPMLHMLNDPIKDVCEAACSALATLIDASGDTQAINQHLCNASTLHTITRFPVTHFYFRLFSIVCVCNE